MSGRPPYNILADRTLCETLRLHENRFTEYLRWVCHKTFFIFITSRTIFIFYCSDKIQHKNLYILKILFTDTAHVCTNVRNIYESKELNSFYRVKLISNQIIFLAYACYINVQTDANRFKIFRKTPYKIIFFD